MRQIKFRAWDKDRKVMVNEIEYFWGKFEKIGYLEVEGTHDGNAEQNQEVSTNFELMQFTGLLDKNNREIYEGDVVKDGESSFSGKYPIEWSEEKACFEVRGTHLTANFLYRHWEIIGNVWENPELLK